MSEQDAFSMFSWIRPAMLERVDTILLAVAGRHFEMTRDIAPSEFPTLQKRWPIETLRASPFGQNLLIIAHSIEQPYLHTSEEVEQAMQRLLRMTYGDPFGDGYTVPATFHTTELGKLFQEAYRSMYRPEELLTIRQVYKELGIAKQSVYDRIEDGNLHPMYYYKEIRLLRQEVEEWNAQRQHRKAEQERRKRSKGTQ